MALHCFTCLPRGLLGHLLQAGIKGELEPQVVAVERSGLETIRKGGAVGAPPHAHGHLLAAQIPVAALLQARLGDPFQVEEAHHIGEQLTLGVNPLWVGLQIDAADAELPDPMGRFRIQPGGQLDAAAAAAEGLQQFAGR